MVARTLFDKRGGPKIGRGAYTPFTKQKRRRPSSLPAVVVEEKKPLITSSRAIRLGHHLHPSTGEIVGDAYLPLPTKPGMNEAINVYGPSGTGKSVLMRRIIEYFSIEEHRCVIVIDPTKNQYWSFSQPQNRHDMIESLGRAGESPASIPEVKVYVPIYDEAILTWPILQRDFHATDLLSIKTAGLTPASFFELGDKDPAGRDFQRYLEEILNRPRAEKTINYIIGELYHLRNQKSTSRSADALINIFEPLTRMGVIRDDGTDIRDMLHPPRKNQPGKISVISLGTGPTDRRRDAILATILQQLFEAVRDDQTLKPVFVIDETKQFAPREKGEHKTTRNALSDFNVLVRAWGVTRVHGFQYQDQVVEALIGENTPYNIELTKSLELYNTETGSSHKLNDTGLGYVHINGVGDPAVPDCDFMVKTFPCRTRHVD